LSVQPASSNILSPFTEDICWPQRLCLFIEKSRALFIEKKSEVVNKFTTVSVLIDVIVLLFALPVRLLIGNSKDRFCLINDLLIGYIKISVIHVRLYSDVH